MNFYAWRQVCRRSIFTKLPESHDATHFDFAFCWGLTYMSITRAVLDAVRRGRLIDRPSSVLGLRARNLYVTPEIDAMARHPFADTDQGVRHAEMCAFFDAFSEMNLITVSQNPRAKPPDVMLARVDPVAEDFWSLRITDPDTMPGIRVLGGFCAKDSFVAISWEFREEIADFDDHVSDAMDRWSDYFVSIKPHAGRRLNDYISNFDEQ